MSRQTMGCALPESMRGYIDKRVEAGNCGNTNEYIRDLVRRDQQGEARYCRQDGRTILAVKVVKATNTTLEQIELDPGIGTLTLG